MCGWWRMENERTPPDPCKLGGGAEKGGVYLALCLYGRWKADCPMHCVGRCVDRHTSKAAPVKLAKSDSTHNYSCSTRFSAYNQRIFWVVY